MLVADDGGGARVLSAQLSSSASASAAAAAAAATTAFPSASPSSSSFSLSPPLTAAAWSPKHRGVFLTAGGDGKLRLWDRRDSTGVSERGERKDRKGKGLLISWWKEARVAAESGEKTRATLRDKFSFFPSSGSFAHPQKKRRNTKKTNQPAAVFDLGKPVAAAAWSPDDATAVVALLNDGSLAGLELTRGGPAGAATAAADRSGSASPAASALPATPVIARQRVLRPGVAALALAVGGGFELEEGSDGSEDDEKASLLSSSSSSCALVAVGDGRGRVTVLKPSPNLRKPLIVRGGGRGGGGGNGEEEWQRRQQQQQQSNGGRGQQQRLDEFGDDEDEEDSSVLFSDDEDEASKGKAEAAARAAAAAAAAAAAKAAAAAREEGEAFGAVGREGRRLEAVLEELRAAGVGEGGW